MLCWEQYLGAATVGGPVHESKSRPVRNGPWGDTRTAGEGGVWAYVLAGGVDFAGAGGGELGADLGDEPVLDRDVAQKPGGRGSLATPGKLRGRSQETARSG